MKINREHLLNAEAWLLFELREMLFWRADLLRLAGYERGCDYGELARRDIREKIAALAAVRVVLKSISAAPPSREPRPVNENRCFQCNNEGFYYAPSGDVPMDEFYCSCAAGQALKNGTYARS